MRILIVPPGNAETLTGNWRTAWRWQQLLQELGHEVDVSGDPSSIDADVLVALHARRCVPLLERVADQECSPVVVVALTGTDLYRDLDRDRGAQESVRRADFLVVLQRDARDRLAPELQRKTHVIYQSAVPLGGDRTPRDLSARESRFVITVVANLREEKDPLRAAHALVGLPKDVPVELRLVGTTIDAELESEARAFEQSDPRFRWLGALPHGETRAQIAASDVLVISSRIEGSCNVLSEALVDDVPVLASRIPGLVGTLGSDYPGYFEVGDTAGLRQLLERVQGDPEFRRALLDGGAAVRPLVEPGSERRAWKALLDAVAGT